MYIALIQNAALLVALSTLYSLGARLRTRGGVWFRLYMGLLFGAVAVAGMMAPFRYSPGIIYDGRSIVLSMAGLFGGLTVAAISAIIAGAFRASLGGAGVWAGLATIVGCSLVGLAFRRAYGNRPDKLAIPALYVLGLAAHVVMLGCQLAFLPQPTGANIVQAIWLPVMSIYPIATVLMGLLLGTEDRRVRAEEALRESEQRFALAVQGANDGIWDWDIKNHTLYWSSMIGLARLPVCVLARKTVAEFEVAVPVSV
jgi:LytS/YehU family sensor histidine kinase